MPRNCVDVEASNRRKRLILLIVVVVSGACMLAFAETTEATRQFDEENVLSRNRYGLVFKACYSDGMVLSIRRLPDGSLDENMFKKEAEFLSKVKHRNLTVLRVYYAGAPDMRLLVYDYLPNGNLATLLQEASHQQRQQKCFGFSGFGC